MPKVKKSNKAKAVPSFNNLIKKTYFELTTFWRPLAGVTITYAVLYFVFILGFSASFGYDNSQNTGQTRVMQAFDATLYSFGGSNSQNSSDATGLLQFILFLIASLAFVWTLRHLQALKNFKVRSAFYKGTASLVPVALVSVLLLLLSLPAAGGSFLVATAILSGSSGLETVVIWLIALIMLALTMALLAMFWPAFYIASLPDSWPIQSMRDALAITKHRRINLLRKLMLFGFVIFTIWVVIMFTIALISTAIVPYASFVLVFSIFAITHTYLYMLYRSLL